jgi:hypothetical protein
MKIKLPVVDQTTLLSDEEMDDLGLPISDEVDYDSLPVINNIFYEIHSIRPINQKYSAVCIGGYEWVIKMSFSKLEKEIDQARHIIISDN